jgi:hypothetical protein
MSGTDRYDVHLRELSFCRVSEEVIGEDVAELAKKIAAADSWTAPISVERVSGIIMDGNHRWHAAVRLGLTHIPCVLLDYADPRVKVYEWECDELFAIDDIFRVVMGQQVFPYKTTRHIFTPALPRTDIGLAELTLAAQRFG